MFGKTRIVFNISGTAVAMQSAGVGEKMAMSVAAGFPESGWKNLLKCTKALNRECKSLCHSITILTLFEQQQRARVKNGELGEEATVNLDIMLSAADRIYISIEEQGMKGNKLALDKALMDIKSIFNFQ